MSTDTVKKQVIQKVLYYINNHLEEDLNLDHIAKVAGYSKYHLSRIFSDTVGCTLHQYIKNKRLEKAAMQLMDTKLPITDIAFLSGYDSQQAFTLAFKQLYLESPNVYRRNRSLMKLRLYSTGREKTYNIRDIKFERSSTRSIESYTFVMSRGMVA